MRFQSWDDLKNEAPFLGGKWDINKLIEYLIQSCSQKFTVQINAYFSRFQNDGDLADLLFSILLDEDYEGSDCQIGAAYYIAQLEQGILKERKELVLQAQENEVLWRRPFQTDEYLTWI